jgi:hypothetical protein
MFSAKLASIAFLGAPLFEMEKQEKGSIFRNGN